MSGSALKVERRKLRRAFGEEASQAIGEIATNTRTTAAAVDEVASRQRTLAKLFAEVEDRQRILDRRSRELRRQQETIVTFLKRGTFLDRLGWLFGGQIDLAEDPAPQDVALPPTSTT